MIHELYKQRCDTGSDINELMPTLKEYADRVDSVAEFGTRGGNSTIAFMRSSCREVHAFDINDCHETVSLIKSLDSKKVFTFTKVDTGSEFEFPKVDMLFIDTVHTYEQVKKELVYAKNVSKYLAFHDTVLFGTQDEFTNETGGIMKAINEFMGANPEWKVALDLKINNGLLILERI